MYKIYVDGVLFHDSTLEELQIESGTITRELNKAGSFKFSIYPDHPFYDSIKELKTVIEVYKDGVDAPIFRGRALYPETDFYKKKTYTCEGQFNFLIDSIMRTFNVTTTPADMFSRLVTNHNSQVEANKRFSVGVVSVTGASVKFENTSPDTTQSIMKRMLLDAYGGYIVPRLSGGVWYLDYLSDFTEQGTQIIEFGENLTKFTRKDNYSDIVTALIPYGKNDMTVSSANGGSDIVTDATGVSLYGTIVGTEKFDDISNATTLLNTAKEHLANLVKTQIVIELNAVDLSLLDKSIAPLRIGTYNRIISEPHSLDDWFLITKQTINLTDPTKDSVVLGGTFETLTEQNAGGKNIVKTIDSTVEKAIENSDTIKTISSKVDQMGGDHLADRNNPHEVTLLQVGGSNPNLLDNWYFADPINQRGGTVHGSGYGIDRFAIDGTGATLTLNKGFATFASSSVQAVLIQSFENTAGLIGKTITLSALVKNNSGRVRLGVARSSKGLYNENGVVNMSEVSGDGLVTLTATLGDVLTGTQRFNFCLYLSTNASCDIVAMKLELGSQQTLARQENGVWVLNDPPPNKQQELAKCQRYFYRIDANSGGWGVIGVGQNMTSTRAHIYVPFPTTMRTMPSLSYSDMTHMKIRTGSTVATLTTIIYDMGNPHGVLLRCTTSTNMTAGNGSEALLYNSVGSWVAFSADL